MAKVLLFNGSPIKEGNTWIALSEVAKTLEKEGIQTEILQLGNKPVRGCIACQTCKTKGNGVCVFDDDMCNELCRKAGEADGFVFGSPVYWGQPNGALLAIIQRALYANSQNFAYKPFANVAVCRRGGATATFSAMNMAFQMVNMPQVTSQYWNIVYGRAPGEAALDIEGLQTMRTLAQNMTWMLKSFNSQNAPAHPEREPWEPMNFIRE